MRNGKREDAADAAEMIVKGEIPEAQARFNRRPKKPKPPKEETKADEAGKQDKEEQK